MSDETVANLGFKVNSGDLDAAKDKLKGVATEAQNTGKAVDDLNQKTSASFDKTKTAATGLGQAVSGATAEIAKSGSVTQQIEAIVAKTGVSYAAAAAQVKATSDAARAAAPAMSAVGAATAGATREAEALGGALGGGSGGGLLGALRGLPSLIVPVSAGFGVLAVAGAGLLLGLAKIGDEAERAKNRLSGLTESTGGGARLFDAITAASKRTGIEFSTLEAATELGITGLEKFADKHIIYANSAEMSAKKAKDLGDAIASVGQIMQVNGANADEEKKALTALGSSFDQTGTLGVAAFQKIRAESPSTALAIANAFGKNTVKEFVDQLALTPISLDDFVRRMAQIAPQIGAPINTVSQSVRDLHQEWDRFIQSLADTGAVNAARSALTGMVNGLEGTKKALEESKNSASDWSGGWVGYLKAADQGSSAAFGSMTTAIKKFNADGSEELRQFNQFVIDWAKSVASAIGAAASAVAGAMSGIAKGGGGTASTNPMGDVTGAGEPQVDMGSGAGSSSGGGFSPVGGNDASQTDFASAVGDGTFPAFASGTDSAPGGLATINEQGGEIVNLPGGSQVIPHDISMQMAGGAVASVKEITDAISQSTIDISTKVSEGSDNIVKALKNITGGGSSTVNPATGLSVASSTAATGSVTDRLSAMRGQSGGGGGGGFSTKPGEALPQWFKDAMKEVSGGGGSDPMYAQGTGSGAYRGFITGSGFGSPTGQFAGSSITSGATDYSGDGTINGSIFGAGSSDFYATDYGGSGTMSGSISDVGTMDMLGSDPNAMNYGGGSFDAGYFATGGKFTVPGSPSGGTDRTLVKMHVTPGEEVIVVPKGAPTPDGVNVPSLVSAAPSSPSMAAQSNSTTTTKNVTINVMPGIQAESFIRSRAQIARGL